MEKRNFNRVEFSVFASVRYEGRVFFCVTRNVSLQGLFMITNQEVPLNAGVEITIYDSLDSSFPLNANVVRCEETGLAVLIKGIDVHSFNHLWDLVTSNDQDQDIITRGTHGMAECIR